MKRFSSFLALLALLAPLSSLAGPYETCLLGADQEKDAKAMAQKAADEALCAVRMERKTSKDGALTRAQSFSIAQHLIAPKADFRKMAQRAMGPLWRKADDSQKTRVSEALGIIAMRTYSTAIGSWTDGTPVAWREPVIDQDSARARGSIRSANSSGPMQFEFALSRNDQGFWRLEDIVIEGVSFAASYRSSFQSASDSGGLEKMINDLEAKAKS